MRTHMFRCFVGCLLAALLCLSSALAQTVTGSITGQVTDPSGAVIVGAKVTAENTATSVKTSAQTNGSGAYTIRFLPIGTYTVTVEATGFTTQRIPPFALEIAQTAKIDASMEIGSSTVVVVKAEMHPILDTNDATLGNTLSANEIENIPLNGRNFSSLTLFQPGSIDTDPTGMSGNNAIERSTFMNSTAMINGNRPQANNYTVEGADNNEPQNNLIGYNPAPDAIAELRVVSANANATYGNVNGGAVVTILKSGTNHFHGSLYDLLQNEKLDANSWGNGLTIPVTPKNSYTQDIFGGTIGGPVVRNKLFFFADYEGARHHTGGITSASVLTPDMLQGNFSALTAKGIQLYDTQNNFAPYLNNQVPVVNPVAKYLAAHPNLYPAPNAAPEDGLLQNNYLGSYSGYVSNNQEDFKVDWTPGNVNKINGFYSQGTGKDFTTAIIPVFFPSENTYPTKIAGVSWVHTFSPSIINEARFGFTRVRWNNGVPTDPSGLFGLTGDKTVGIPFGAQLFVGFSGESLGSGASYVGTNANLQVFTDNTFNYTDNLTWQRGRHYLSIGGQATRYQQNYVNASNVGFLGQFSYYGQYTENLNVSSGGGGYGPADFVLDRVSNDQLASPTGWVGNRQWRVAGYFQDDFKVSPRLTLNLGLRYEFDQPWYEQNNKTANVLPNATVEYADHVPAGAVAGSIVCPTRACYDANYKQIMPRLGFAFQMMPKLVIRGGYGASSFFEGYSFNQRLTSSPPFTLAINSSATPPSTTSGGTPYTVEEGFGNNYGADPAYNLYSVWPQHTQPAYIQQYNLTTEYAVTNQLSLSVGYHGQYGQHLADYRNGNQLTLAQATIIAGLPSGTNTCDSTVLPAAAVAPYASLVGQCGPILVTESEAEMNYNAAQVTLRQRPTHGLEYTLNYTWSKSMTDAVGDYGVPNTSMMWSTVQNGYDLQADYGPSGMDIRHSMNFVGVYHLPFGRGQAYGGNANGFLDAVFGGWKLSTSAILYSGIPVTIMGPSDNGTNSVYGMSRANHYRPLVVHNRSISHWWGTDPSATGCTGPDNGVCAYGAAVIPSGLPTFGTAGVDTERAPGYRQVDISLFKDFHVWRENVLGFRADFFNFFNIASYGNPDYGVTDSNFGQITSTRSQERHIQIGLHYNF
ncbi:MAG: TonB-dependent receptor [Terriglobales bacterium]|jgi:hypothetical protein